MSPGEKLSVERTIPSQFRGSYEKKVWELLSIFFSFLRLHAGRPPENLARTQLKILSTPGPRPLFSL